MNIVILSTYPIQKPQHGGQIRLSQIVKLYEKHGHRVTHISIREAENYCGEFNPDKDIPFPVNSQLRLFKGQNVPLINDLLSGIFITQDNTAKQRLYQMLPKEIDIIQVEQPWLFNIAFEIKIQHSARQSLLIYSSQNVEWELKQKILSKYGIPQTMDVVNEIKALEIRASKNADISFAVAKYDEDFLIQSGAKKTVLAPNGVEDKGCPSQEIMNQHRHLFPANPFALYIGSAHPPNATGFFSIFKNSFGCLVPTQKVVLLGGVCDLIKNSPEHKEWAFVNESRIVYLGKVEDHVLDVAKQLAHTIILPITEGGGSNLKTAEALRSPAYVVGTSTSFRGYEDHTNRDGVYIEDEPRVFQDKVRESLFMQKFSKREKRLSETQSVTWNETLKNIIPQIQNTIK